MWGVTTVSINCCFNLPAKLFASILQHFLSQTAFVGTTQRRLLMSSEYPTPEFLDAPTHRSASGLPVESNQTLGWTDQTITSLKYISNKLYKIHIIKK